MNMDVETTPTQSERLSHWANTSIPETCRNEEHNTQGHRKSGNCVFMEIIISKAVWVTQMAFHDGSATGYLNGFMCMQKMVERMQCQWKCKEVRQRRHHDTAKSMCG